ncbi:hypothetical protein TNCV_310321 [Trichonephila clavipes]|nr:hypothetical protein TNCV_310321 [Trichonephila clavipes]
MPEEVSSHNMVKEWPLEPYMVSSNHPAPKAVTKVNMKDPSATDTPESLKQKTARTFQLTKHWKLTRRASSSTFPGRCSRLCIISETCSIGEISGDLAGQGII